MRPKGKKTEKLRYKLELLNAVTRRVVHTQLFATIADIADVLGISYQQAQHIKYGKNNKMKKFAIISRLP